MKNIMLTILVLLITQISCGKQANTAKTDNAAPFSGTVLTVKSGGGYSFLEVQGTTGKFWVATRPIEAKKGDTVQAIHPMKMEKFPVKSLNRTFDVIYFADDVLVNGKGHMGDNSSPMGMGMGVKNKMANPHGGKMENPHEMGKAHMGEDTNIDASAVKPEKGSVAIRDILENPGKFAGKEITVHAVVTKFLPMIMKKNWLHLKDATCGKGHLVATTNETFKKGETVILKGKVETNKDFGFGYKYAVLLTGATSGK